jgi:hypothetical protein
VALKVIKPGMDSRAVLARFAADGTPVAGPTAAAQVTGTDLLDGTHYALQSPKIGTDASVGFTVAWKTVTTVDPTPWAHGSVEIGLDIARVGGPTRLVAHPFLHWQRLLLPVRRRHDRDARPRWLQLGKRAALVVCWSAQASGSHKGGCRRGQSRDALGDNHTTKYKCLSRRCACALEQA